MSNVMRVVCCVGFSLAAALSGCATIAHGTTQAIPITSSPEGARVVVDSVDIGVTPLLATVSRKRAHVVSIVHDSFPPVRVVMDHSVSPWVLGSFFFYVFPAIVDFSNGAAYGFSVDSLHVNLARQSNSGESQPAVQHLTKGISGASLATAVTANVLVGYGVGQAMVGLRAKPFLVTELVGGTVAFTGLAMGISRRDDGAPLLLGGAGAMLVSRVWSIVDLFQNASKQNGPDPTPAHATSRDGLAFSPFFDARSKGFALRYSF